uniref:Uncharacterized protein n=1 Tax=Eutreptiella gymnastica TaxID=73025 RepID=A0A7S4LMX6_9EUGL
MIRLWDGENFIEKEQVSAEEKFKGPATLEEAREKYITGYSKLQYDPDTVQRSIDRFRLKTEQRIFQNEKQKHDVESASDQKSPFDILVGPSTAIGPANSVLPSGLVLKKKRKRDSCKSTSECRASTSTEKATPSSDLPKDEGVPQPKKKKKASQGPAAVSEWN